MGNPISKEAALQTKPGEAIISQKVYEECLPAEMLKESDAEKAKMFICPICL